MAEITLTAASNPFTELEAFFRRLEHPGSGEVRKVADAVRQGFQESFTSESSAGAPWAELAPLTVARRQAAGYGGAHPMLVQTGSYRNSWVNAGAPNHVQELVQGGGGWELFVGSDDDRANLHERGGNTVIQGKQVYVPPRPVGILSDGAENRVAAVLDFVIDQIQAQTVGR